MQVVGLVYGLPGQKNWTTYEGPVSETHRQTLKLPSPPLTMLEEDIVQPFALRPAVSRMRPAPFPYNSRYT